MTDPKPQGGIGPLRTDRPEWRACRSRTPEESHGIYKNQTDRIIMRAVRRYTRIGGDRP